MSKEQPNMKAPVLYILSFAVNPTAAKPLFAWLDGSHCKEVATQPGFLFCHRVRLEQHTPDGWDRYMMIYGVESEEALQAYFSNQELKERFAREREPYNPHLRIERAWGNLETSF
jgi:heme-degrading monooxygenase HmoA